MTALVIIAHPDPTSLTHRVGATVAATLAEADVATEVADLHAEGFDPRFSLADRRRYHAAGPVPADVLAEQERLDAVDDLVLVFPVYWWSMPALLKGWVDRVFINGWAFDDRVVPPARKLGRMTVHLVMLGAEDAAGYARRGYDTAISTQIVTGVIGFCGAQAGVTTLLHESDTRPSSDLEPEAAAAAREIAAAASRRAVGV
jgi:NAD(P)H dehydrogenase (quinone)